MSLRRWRPRRVNTLFVGFACMLALSIPLWCIVFLLRAIHNELLEMSVKGTPDDRR